MIGIVMMAYTQLKRWGIRLARYHCGSFPHQAWLEKGNNTKGYLVCKYAFKVCEFIFGRIFHLTTVQRLPDQPPLSIRAEGSDDEAENNENEDSKSEAADDQMEDEAALGDEDEDADGEADNDEDANIKSWNWYSNVTNLWYLADVYTSPSLLLSMYSADVLDFYIIHFFAYSHICHLICNLTTFCRWFTSSPQEIFLFFLVLMESF